MKKYFVLALILSVASVLTGCVSSTVERVDFDSQQDLSGYWNDTDARIVSNDLAEQLTDSSWYNRFIQENDRKPVIIIGSIRNNTDEHINTSIISKKLEISLINTGKVLSVANSSERKEIRDERDDQQINASIDSAKNIGNETAADFMLRGDIKTIVDSDGLKSVRTYFITAELVDIETNTKIWLGENSTIKKVIRYSATRF
ncbi:MAG: penicillin-binding protein activator LpoB [Treponema sp.]|uniref:penicillin-binding protein activator LpoB n=1 Tax=Treponema sp. TaxID=166 RepID=UPI001D5ED3E3|nr:penicillin-binding protein activator LpoB [Treponema sp.]MBS7310518.1 penicillin-binding protein activator LpoB [Treponema sp.]MCI5696270.1 penicillin-binding protein activator LpoB [Spirochaetia bacterium]MDD5812353.1 penicillin-binding protein activator LpoB [Treponema sp.]MDY5885975.1 penicillin-binding protein activator LpoB [Treponema sp.]